MKTLLRTVASAVVVLALVGGVSSLTACGKGPAKPEAALDTPEHHYLTGIRLSNKEDWDGAMRAFQRAVDLDPKFAPGYAGMGLVHGAKGEYKEAYKAIDKAKDLQKSPTIVAEVMKIRVLSMERKKDWLEDAEDEYKTAMKRDSQNAELHFYMGRAYRMGLEFDKSADQFKTVLDLNKDFTGEADKEWHVVQKIQRAAPGTMIGKQIAIIEKIGRADAAALFIQELNIDRLFEKRGKTFDPSFKSPVKEEFKADVVVAMEPATDIAAHPLKADIDTVIKLGVRGLEPSPDHKFEPSKPLLKAEYAVMLEDIMIRITGDTKLATQFFGQKSPYPDMRPDMYYFNAAVLLGSRGILEADKVTGEFGGGQVVSGADALLAIRMFKEALKI